MMNCCDIDELRFMESNEPISNNHLLNDAIEEIVATTEEEFYNYYKKRDEKLDKYLTEKIEKYLTNTEVKDDLIAQAERQFIEDQLKDKKLLESGYYLANYGTPLVKNLYKDYDKIDLYKSDSDESPFASTDTILAHIAERTRKSTIKKEKALKEEQEIMENLDEGEELTNMLNPPNSKEYDTLVKDLSLKSPQELVKEIVKDGYGSETKELLELLKTEPKKKKK